ncbi:ABC transporter substrate-binding protein [Corynebacterium flavescens]|uniref:ABC transporter substrate-binding protein n=1 Tax=Corynebacterium flavescens TaxID=28028 RepID=UPI000EBACFA0|nr:ABC transporter substrate-binding protein [Corynebacterium flavescens]
MTFSRLLAPTALAPAALLLTSCSSNADSTQAGSESSSEANGAYPVSIGNCGTEIEIDKPIESAVSLDQGMTEIMLSLGLADRMSGTATWTDPVREDLEDANSQVPRISENIPSLETVLKAEPDFVAASFYPTLSESGGGNREKYAEVGVPAYLAYSDCSKTSLANDGAREERVTMDAVYHDISDIATLFEVKDKGEALVEDLQERMDSAQRTTKTDNVSVAYWFSDSEAPYMAGGVGAPQLISETLGLDNVFADSKEEWPQVSWEALVEKNPDVIVVGDLTRDNFSAESAKAKIDFLKKHPVASQLDAVKNERFVSVAGADMNPSIRTVDGIEKVAKGLTEFNLNNA